MGAQKRTTRLKTNNYRLRTLETHESALFFVHESSAERSSTLRTRRSLINSFHKSTRKMSFSTTFTGAKIAQKSIVQKQSVDKQVSARRTKASEPSSGTQKKVQVAKFGSLAPPDLYPEFGTYPGGGNSLIIPYTDEKNAERELIHGRDGRCWASPEPGPLRTGPVFRGLLRVLCAPRMTARPLRTSSRAPWRRWPRKTLASRTFGRFWPSKSSWSATLPSPRYL